MPVTSLPPASADAPGHGVLGEVRVRVLVDGVGLAVLPVLQELRRRARVVDLVEVHAHRLVEAVAAHERGRPATSTSTTSRSSRVEAPAALGREAGGCGRPGWRAATSRAHEPVEEARPRMPSPAADAGRSPRPVLARRAWPGAEGRAVSRGGRRRGCACEAVRARRAATAAAARRSTGRRPSASSGRGEHERLALRNVSPSGSARRCRCRTAARQDGVEVDEGSPGSASTSATSQRPLRRPRGAAGGRTAGKR